MLKEKLLQWKTKESEALEVHFTELSTYWASSKIVQIYKRRKVTRGRNPILRNYLFVAIHSIQFNGKMCKSFILILTLNSTALFLHSVTPSINRCASNSMCAILEHLILHWKLVKNMIKCACDIYPTHLFVCSVPMTSRHIASLKILHIFKRLCMRLGAKSSWSRHLAVRYLQ